MTEKRNPDYTASAINLCNPDEVRMALIDLHEAQQDLQERKALADALIPESIRNGIDEAARLVGDLTASLKDAIEKIGSYQDVEAGHYAIQQLKKSSVYHVAPFKEHFSKHVGSVVEETINKKALEGLVKGKLVEQGDLEMHKVVTYDETRAFIIK